MGLLYCLLFLIFYYLLVSLHGPFLIECRYSISEIIKINGALGLWESLSQEGFHLLHQTTAPLKNLYHLNLVRGLDGSNLDFRHFYFCLKWINLTLYLSLKSSNNYKNSEFSGYFSAPVLIESLGQAQILELHSMCQQTSFQRNLSFLVGGPGRGLWIWRKSPTFFFY